MTKLFDPADEANDQEPESFYAELVGEGKKFQDNEALAKGKWHSDRHARRLEEELEQTRQELQRRLTAEDLVKQLQTANAANTRNDDRDPEDKVELPDLSHLKGEVLTEVQRLLKEQQTQSQAERNVAKVTETLQTAWGSNFKSKLAARARELDLDQDYLASLAQSKPDTFLKIVLPKDSLSNDYVPTTSSTRTTVSASGERNKAYYDKIRKENPKLYYSKQIQAQEHRDAIRLGRAFFNA